MAGLKEEYFMWDQRFQLGYNCLDRRLQDTNERAMQQIAQLNEQNKQLAAITKQVQEDNSSLRDRIQQLEQTSSRMPKFDNQIQDLAASTKQLQKNNSSLRDRIQQLEQTSPGILQLEQTSTRITQLDEQIQDLAASSSDLKEQSNDSNYRILQIEQEGTHRDQENQLVQEQLKEKLDALKGNVEGVVAAMNGMNEMAGLDRAQRVKEIQHLKSQIENIIAAWHTTGGYARDGKSEECARRRCVSNICYSINRHITAHYRGREDTSRQSC